MVSMYDLGLFLFQLGAGILLVMALIELIAHDRRRHHRQSYADIVGDEFSILLPRDRDQGSIRNAAGELVYTIKTTPPTNLKVKWHPRDFEFIDAKGKLAAVKLDAIDSRHVTHVFRDRAGKVIATTDFLRGLWTADNRGHVVVAESLPVLSANAVLFDEEQVPVATIKRSPVRDSKHHSIKIVATTPHQQLILLLLGCDLALLDRIRHRHRLPSFRVSKT